MALSSINSLTRSSSGRPICIQNTSPTAHRCTKWPFLGSFQLKSILIYVDQLHLSCTATAYQMHCLSCLPSWFLVFVWLQHGPAAPERFPNKHTMKLAEHSIIMLSLNLLSRLSVLELQMYFSGGAAGGGGVATNYSKAISNPAFKCWTLSHCHSV